jgi:hypothetical protein
VFLSKIINNVKKPIRDSVKGESFQKECRARKTSGKLVDLIEPTSWKGL